MLLFYNKVGIYSGINAFTLFIYLILPVKISPF